MYRESMYFIPTYKTPPFSTITGITVGNPQKIWRIWRFMSTFKKIE